ncbi:MAG TPA: hypothetical protein VK559_00635 [Ferruginibacter sp.]|nr:hypothetical protein [Ferruginibacter sp.]
MRYTILIVAISVIFIACKKDKSSKPQISIQSVNSTVINEGDLLIFTLSFKNLHPSEADTLNVREIAPCPGNNFSQNYGVPLFSAPSNEGGIMTVSFINYTSDPPYIYIAAQCDSDEIARFQFKVTDQNNNSDSILSEPITIKQ